MSTNSHKRKRQSVCLNCLHLKLFKFDLMNRLKYFIRWINKGRKDSCEKGTSLTCVYTRSTINAGGEDLYLTKYFIWKQRETFLSSNCEATLSSDFHSDTSNFEGWGSTLVAYSCLCWKARFKQRVVVWTIQPSVRIDSRILIKGAQRNVKQKNPYSSNHLQNDT